MSRRRKVLGTLVLVVALVLVAPTLASVYSEADVTVTLAPGWLALMAALTSLQFATSWALQRVLLGSDGWFDIAAAQLAGNAGTHLLPAGSATGAGLQVRMLTVAGFSLPNALTGLGASSILSSAAGFVALPVLVLLGAAAGSRVEPRLVTAMLVGAALLALLLVALVAIAVRDVPWRRLAHALGWLGRRVNRPVEADELERTLLRERDIVRDAIRQRGWFVALTVVIRPTADYLALYVALRAVGADINPAAVLAAFIVSNIAGMIPITPGGLGFVEAGLAGTIGLAGATSVQANAATATYRLLTTWLPCLAGLVAYTLFRRRHRDPRVLATD